VNTSLYFIIALILLLFGCRNNNPNISEPNAEEIKKIVPVGKQITQEILKALKNELQVAIAEGGFEKAISVCNLKAIPLTKNVEK